MKIKIGGTEGNGVSHFEGFPPTNGWEMKLEVDSNGNVTGKNKNDAGPGANVEKTYKGTYKDGVIQVTVVFTSTGQVNEIQGKIVGDQFTGTVKVIKGPSMGLKGTVKGKVTIKN